jgi:hypothetical protein
MDYWTSGPGWQQLSAGLVADDQRGTDERKTTRPTHRRTGQTRRVIAGALVALAARLAPAEASPTIAVAPMTSAARP